MGFSQTERIARLRLARSETIGPVTYHELLAHFPSAEEAVAALPSLAARGGRKGPIRIPGKAEAEREMAAVEALGAQLVIHGEAGYPRRLAAIDPPPPVISLRGAAHLLERKAIAIVGARNASAAGMKLAATIARDLGEQGFTIVSGLARGIDAAAHRAALGSGTAGVLGGGLDVVYPEENRELYRLMADQGVLVAEMPPGTQPRGKLFPRRNRIISGLALAVVVAEAALRSGSLITARFALEQGRDVFAVPGSPLDPRAHGSNGLIKQGAPLVENAGDIVAALEQIPSRCLEEPGPLSSVFGGGRRAYAEPEAEARALVLSALGPVAVHIDEIVRHTGLPVAQVRVVLLELDLAGRLHREAGGGVNLLPGMGEG